MLAELTLTRRQFHGLVLAVAWAMKPHKPHLPAPASTPAPWSLSAELGLAAPGAIWLGGAV